LRIYKLAPKRPKTGCKKLAVGLFVCLRYKFTNLKF
jgi:hypothetical protein